MRIKGYLLIIICFLPSLLFRDFTPNNELKYLSIADEALRNGHVFTFWNHGIAYADKPPLYLWIVMLGKWLFGQHSMLFLGLFSLVPACLILYIMDKWCRNVLPSSLRISGSLMLISSGLFTGSALVLRMDMLMALFIVLALYTFYKLYTHQNGPYDTFLLPLYIFLAVFTKGPIGIIIPLISIFVFLLVKKQIRNFGKFLGWKQWSILLGLFILWFLVVYLEGGKEYLNNLVFHQTVNRAVNSFHHKKPVWYYFVTIWYSLFPWIFLYLTLILIGIKKHLFHTDLKKLFLTVISTTFLLLSLFSGKLDIYLLPIFPFIAYLAFLILPDIRSNYLRFAIAIPDLLLLFTFPAFFWLVSHFPILQNPFFWIAASLLSACSLISLVFLFRKHFIRSTNTLSIGILLTLLTGGFAISGINSQIGLEEVCQKAETLARQNNIQHYYFYKFRSGENMDVYLKEKIDPIDIDTLPSPQDKQNFIIFVKDNQVAKEDKLQHLCSNNKTYSVGNYKIIVY